MRGGNVVWINVIYQVINGDERSPAFIALDSEVELSSPDSFVNPVSRQTNHLRKFSDREALSGMESLAE